MPGQARERAETQLTSEERHLRAQLGAHTQHGLGHTNTEPARAALLARFESEADPEGVLDPAERRRRAEHLRKAEMARIGLMAARAKREQAARRAAERTARAADAAAEGSAS